MNRKQAHQRKNKDAFYRRNTVKAWMEDYNAAQFKWLVDHKHLVMSEPMTHLGENPDHKFMAFSRKGAEWFDWYSMSFKEYLKYKVFRYLDFKIAWQRFRIACGHRYPWMDY